MQLPCSKAMWEAETTSAWETAQQRVQRSKQLADPLLCGHLQLMNSLDASTASKDIAADLSLWSKDLDSLGAIVLLTMTSVV